MRSPKIELYRKNLKWNVELNGGVIARAWTLRGVQRRIDIASKLFVFADGVGTL